MLGHCLYYVPVREKRMNKHMLARYGFAPESPDVFLLSCSAPSHNTDTERVVDTNTVAGPDEFGRYAVVYEVRGLPTDVALSNVKTTKLAEIISGSNACAAMVKGRYSALEIDSWAIQQTQAEMVLSGGTLPPDALLVALAVANGVSVEAFAQRVMGNVTAAENMTKWVVATQQGYETRLKGVMADDKLDDAAKIAAIQGIEIKFELPDQG